MHKKVPHYAIIDKYSPRTKWSSVNDSWNIAEWTVRQTINAAWDEYLSRYKYSGDFIKMVKKDIIILFCKSSIESNSKFKHANVKKPTDQSQTTIFNNCLWFYAIN